MAVSVFTSTNGMMLDPGTYKIIAIGWGGDGAKGGTSPSGNNVTSGEVDGAVGAGGGAGAFVLFKELNLSSAGFISFNFEPELKKLTLIGAVNAVIPQSGSGNSAPVPPTSLTLSPIPGNSVAPADVEYVGTRGGGAGGSYGVRGSTTAPNATPGGLGTYGNGGAAVVPAISGTVRPGGTGGAGGGNNAFSGQGGQGGQGLQAVGVTESITLQDVVQAIKGGNGSNGTAPSSRPAQAGIAGAYGAGGGGAWTSGSDGAAPGAPGYHVNGAGGAGGIGGLPAVIVISMAQRIR